MATIEEVVDIWDKTHPNEQTEILKGKNVQPNGKIWAGSMYTIPDKWAVVKLSKNYPHKPWNKHICYVFFFTFDKQTEELIGIEIRFERRIKKDPNSQIFYEFLRKSFADEKINGKEIFVSEGKINPNHLLLKVVFPINSSAQDICNGMEKLINLTQKPICDFLK